MKEPALSDASFGLLLIAAAFVGLLLLLLLTLNRNGNH